MPSTYYSLAGPFLEDLKLIDHFFPDMKLVSLESDADTLLRQKFHLFSSRIQLIKSSMNRYLNDEYDPEENDEGVGTLWLDYTDMKYGRFDDFQVALKKVPLFSVVRITLRAEPEFDLKSLDGKITEEEKDRLTASAQESFERKYSRLLPNPRPSALADPKDFARTVQLMVKRAASVALDYRGSDRDFLPVHSTRYDDGTQMLSVTGIVYRRGEEGNIRQRIARVRFADFDWGEPVELDMPAISVKEAMRLEHHLPAKDDADIGSVLFSELGYCIDHNDESSKAKLAYYANFYREYPHFIRFAS
jgi:hypothetical protein